jgi:lipopolysaccharide export system protein LptA
MNRTTSFLTVAVVWTGLALTGCGKFTGTYETSNGVASISFLSGKVYITMMGDTELCDYEMNGDKIIVHTKTDNVVLTRNEDGTLDGPLGNMKKRRS